MYFEEKSYMGFSSEKDGLIKDHRLLKFLTRGGLPIFTLIMA
jgi:hypothetical protein